MKSNFMINLHGSRWTDELESNGQIFFGLTTTLVTQGTIDIHKFD